MRGPEPGEGLIVRLGHRERLRVWDLMRGLVPRERPGMWELKKGSKDLFRGSGELRETRDQASRARVPRGENKLKPGAWM